LNLGVAGTSGDVTDPQLKQSIVGFVKRQLQANSGAGIDAVVVLGGPPCTLYSCAKPECNLLPKRAAANAAKKDWETAQQQAAAALHELQLLQAQNVSSPALTVKKAAADKAAAALQQAAAKKEAAEAAAELDGIALQRSDDVVEAFLALYKAVKVQCAAAGKPCCLLMENPESNPGRGMWNRCATCVHLRRRLS
jgi:hypothetical protein